MGSPRRLLTEERRRRITKLIRDHSSVTAVMLARKFAVSPMTVRRDLAILEQEGQLRRTHGGAVRPRLVDDKDSFQYRVQESVDAKRRLATAAIELLKQGEIVFMEGSAATYYIAKQITEVGLAVTVVTNSIPIMSVVAMAEVPGLELVGIGGFLQQGSLVFVGPHVISNIGAIFADRTFLSVDGVARNGWLTTSDPLEAEVKRCMIDRAKESVLLIDGSEFERRGASVVTHVSDIDLVLAENISASVITPVTNSGAPVQLV